MQLFENDRAKATATAKYNDGTKNSHQTAFFLKQTVKHGTFYAAKE